MRYALTLVLAALCCVTAQAETATYKIGFTATGDGINAKGSYLLTFDPIKDNQFDITTGLVTLSFADGYTPPTSVGYRYFYSTDYMYIGGTVGLVEMLTQGSDDYALGIRNFLAGGVFDRFSLASTSLSSTYFVTHQGTVSVGPYVTTTPEPSSLALLGTGMLGLIGMTRRRRA